MKKNNKNNHQDNWTLTQNDSSAQYGLRGTVGVNNTPAREGRANAIGTPGNAMTHDVVVGGGHTIEVQKEDGSQITDFSVQEPKSRAKTPNYDGTVASTDKIGATPNADGTVGNTEPQKNPSAPKRAPKSPLQDNFGQVPPCVNSIYGNTDTSHRTYGDFTAKSSKNTEQSGKNESEDKGGDSDAKDRAVTVKSGEKLIKTIVIAGQIEGHTQLPQEQKSTKYEELIPQLVEIEENDEIGGLLLILNTVGGDVEAGLALSELIAGMKKPTASLVLGGGHSIGVPLAVSAKRSFIVPSATMTLHPVRVTGLVLSAPQTYVYLNNMQERIIDFVCSHSNIKSERFYSLMLAREEMSTDLGSVLDGKKAVDEGIIDALGSLDDAICYLRSEAQIK